MKRSLSLEEHEESFMRAQHMMATGLVAPLPPPRWPLVKTSSTPPRDPLPPWFVPAGDPVNPPSPAAPSNPTRSRGRPPTSRKATKRRVDAQQPWPGGSAISRATHPQPPLHRPAEARLPPRKPAYAVQKEHRQALMDQVKELEAHVDGLRQWRGLPTHADRQKIAKATASCAELDEKVHACRRYATKLKAEVTNELRFPVVNSLVTSIHLPCDMDRRRNILQNLKDVKIRRAADVGLARFQHHDPVTPSLSQELFMTGDGSFHCHRWELVVLPNFTSARKMFDALFFFVYNLEISVTEMVNQVAVREDDEDIGPTIWNHRIVTTTEDIGCLEELNMVGFADFFEIYGPLDGGPLGVIVIETVDEDDLYPYVPENRVRKNFQSFFLFCEAVDPVTRQKTIVLKTCLICEQLPPQFPMDPALIAKLYEYTPRWMKLMNQYLREYATPVPS